MSIAWPVSLPGIWRRWGLVSCVALIAFGCGRSAIENTGPTAEWPAYGGDAGGLRYSPLTQITPKNVNALRRLWTYRSGDFSEGSDTATRTSLQVTPIVVDRTLYFCTPFNRVIALDAETGSERWTFDPVLKLRQLHGGYPMTCRGVSFWRDDKPDGGAGCRTRIFTATQDSQLIALAADTGKPCAGFGTNGKVDLRVGLGEAPPWEYYSTSPPLVVGDLVVVGALVADGVRANAPGGVVRAFDARTGRLRWAWDPVPPGMPSTPPYEGGAQFRRGTANAWGVMSADPERDLIFVSTGNAPPDYFGGYRQGLDYYSSSVVALRASGGKAGQVVWRFQTVHHDLWDYDVAAQPTLFEFPTQQGPRAALAVSTKMGHIFILDRTTGEPLFPVEERQAPQGAAPGEELSPTQPYPTHPPSLFPAHLPPEAAYGLTFWDRGKCRDKIASLRSDGLFTPPSVDGSVHFPGALGGINWGGAAIDPIRTIFVVNQSRIPTRVKLIPRAEFEALPEEERNTKPGRLPGTTVLYSPQAGTPYAVKRELLLSPWGLPCSKPPWGTLTGVDLRSGAVLWEVPLGSSRGQAPWPFWFTVGVPNIGGPIITASGLVFIAATPDRYVRAFDSKSGKELWRADLPFSGHATPITYRLGKDSRQLLVVAAGGHVVSDPGDAIVAFALE